MLVGKIGSLVDGQSATMQEELGGFMIVIARLLRNHPSEFVGSVRRTRAGDLTRQFL